MTLRAFQQHCQFLVSGLMLLVAMLLCTPAGAQTSTQSTVLLTPGNGLTGAWIKNQVGQFPAQSGSSTLSGYLSWQVPVLVAARANYVYVVDSGRRKIFRYDLALQSATLFLDFSTGAVSSITVAPDLSLYVADIKARQVVHYSFEGRLLRTFANDFEMARPVAVVLNESTGNLWIADGMHNHVVVFSSLGRVLTVLRSDDARSIEAMAHGSDGLYLVDRLSRQVVVVGEEGVDRYTLGQDTLRDPGAIAVDRFNRVFVSDSFDNTIKVYEHNDLVASVGRSGAVPSSFNRITGLWVDQNVLYVADSLNARIQTFHIAPPGVRIAPHDD